MPETPPPIETKIPSLPAGWHGLTKTFLSDGSLAVLGTDQDIASATSRLGVSGNRTNPAKERTAKIWTLMDGQFVESLTFPLEDPYPLFDKFPDGRWAVGKPRNHGKSNVQIVNRHVATDRRLFLGDSIEHIQIDGRGRIWVGWYDEGVIGNQRWRVPGHEWPPSSYGIGAFSDRGEHLACAQSVYICDCYALNVFQDEAWSCPYTDFPIWSSRNGKELHWQTSLRGPSAIAVRFPYVVAAGGYRAEKRRAVLLELKDGHAEELAEFQLPSLSERPSPTKALFGRGAGLHLVEDDTWLRWSVDDFLSAAG